MEFVCFVWISEQTVNFAFHNIKRLDFITKVESVYCAVRAESLYNTHKFYLQKVKPGPWLIAWDTPLLSSYNGKFCPSALAGDHSN